MATAGDLVKRSLRLLSVLTRGEVAASEDMNEALIALNDLMHSMYADNTLVPSLTREQLTLTQGKASYTIGSGADLDTTRPMSIASLVLRDGDTDYWLDEMPQSEFARIAVKDYQVRPDRFYYEEGWPSGTIYLDSEPDKAYTVFLTAYKPHTDLANLTTTVDLPPMYEKYLAFQGAAELAPEYGMEPPQGVVREAQRARLAIIQRNVGNRPAELMVDQALRDGGGRKYDIRSDE